MNLIELHDLFDEELVKEITFEGKCHDCKKEILVLIEALETGFKVTGGAIYKVHDGEEYKGKKKIIIKCEECYNKKSELSHYQECEVYSRIVGYLRPTNQWNPGKLSEFKDRKTFDKGLEDECRDSA